MTHKTVSIAVLLALANPALAAPVYDCRPMAQIMASITANPTYRSHGILSGEVLAKAVSIYNSVPPESSERWDLVVLVNHIDGSGAMLVGRGGELCNGLRLPAAQWENLINVLFGTEI